MSDQSANLKLTYLAAGQAQKHVSVNESLSRLDALVQTSAVSASTSAEPTAPTDGAVYILPAGKTGAAWGAMANAALAYWRDGAWEQITPREGWLAFVRDTNLLVAYDGAAWTQAAVRTGLGLGTAALKNTGTSGDAVPLLNVSNTFSGRQSIDSSVSDPFYVGPGYNGGAPYNTGDKAIGVTSWSGAAELLLTRHDVNAFFISQGLSGSTTALVISEGYGKSQRLRIEPSGAGMSFIGALLPMVDGTQNIGSGSLRFSTVYATTGTINTSDAREKTTLRALTAAEKRAIRRVIAAIGVFQWLDSIARKGQDAARLHVGVTAQAVRDAFLAEGLDPERWALFCADPAEVEVEIEPARQQTLTVHDGVDEAGATRTREVEVTIPARTERRPLLDPETGEQRVRLGVRADQLFWLALAALAGG